MTHESVLLAESIAWLNPGPGKILIDGTLGLGGHAKRWLESTMPNGQVVGFDRDPEALLEAGRVLKDYGDRAMIFQGNYRDSAECLKTKRIGRVDAILLDLGVNSCQLDTASRGFSFRADGPLDMRMDPSSPVSAETLVNEASEETLRELFWKYGEERFSRQIARRLVEARSQKRIQSTTELENVIFHAVPRAARFGGRLHPATRCFQALRIAVNQEIESLEAFLPQSVDLLATDGRIAVISFHSLEDRLVKNTFRELEQKKLGKILTKKPLTPSEAEQTKNPRSRSAKMRVFERGTREAES